MSNINKNAQQAKAKAEKTGKTVTKEVTPGLIYKIKVRSRTQADK